jgi:hypothetical protein
MAARRRPGEIRDAIRAFLATTEDGASIGEIQAAVEEHFAEEVAPSSVRSALNLGVGDLYERLGRGRYCLRRE